MSSVEAQAADLALRAHLCGRSHEVTPLLLLAILSSVNNGVDVEETLRQMVAHVAREVEYEETLRNRHVDEAVMRRHGGR